ncbi:MAG: 50S ribosomal protein L29 [Opitutales bacterium]|jgi:large subunit ribosomal protein L29
MKLSEIRELSATELDKQLRDHRDELLSLRLKQSAGQVENPARFRDLRRAIARVETIKREKAVVPAAK